VPQPRHQASSVALELIKRFEGFRARAAQLPDGRWTIGHGHSKTAREGAEVTLDDAEALLIYDLRQVTQVLDEVVFTPLTQNQVDALASFVFNIGVDNFRDSTVLRRINAGAMHEAAFALEIWRKADFAGERIVVDALVRRRAVEKSLFLTPQDGFIPTPSPVLAPKADHGLAVNAPLTAPTEVETPLDGPLTESAHGPSPVEAAAAKLAVRLQALAPEEPVVIHPADKPVFEPEPFAAAPDIKATSDPGPEPAPFPRAEPAAPSNVESMRRAIFGIPEPKPKPEPQAFAPLLLLGGTGLAAFIGAVVWAFHAKPANPAVLAVGFVGILCVASAVYLLLEKLAGRDD
jgi:lysozyme